MLTDLISRERVLFEARKHPCMKWFNQLSPAQAGNLMQDIGYRIHELLEADYGMRFRENASGTGLLDFLPFRSGALFGPDWAETSAQPIYDLISAQMFKPVVVPGLLAFKSRAQLDTEKEEHDAKVYRYAGQIMGGIVKRWIVRDPREWSVVKLGPKLGTWYFLSSQRPKYLRIMSSEGEPGVVSLDSLLCGADKLESVS